MRDFRPLQQFNWRLSLMRIATNAVALTITALILPRVYFVDLRILNILFLALMLGVLNALIKPVIQFLTLSFIFVTYGLVVALINGAMLWLLAYLFPTRFEITGIGWVLVAGVVFGLLSTALESLFGVTMPVLPDSDPELRRQLAAEMGAAERLRQTVAEGSPSSLSAAAQPPGAPTPQTADVEQASMTEPTLRPDQPENLS